MPDFLLKLFGAAGQLPAMVCMMKPPASFSNVKLIPTRNQPFDVRDSTAAFREAFGDLLDPNKPEDGFRYLQLTDKSHDFSLWNDFQWLSLAEVISLAEGKELAAPLGEVEASGRLRMVRGHEGDNLVMVMIEFLPDEAVPRGLAFDAWFRLRFPESSCYLHESRNEEWWMHFHGLWAEEIRPAPTVAPDDVLLRQAALNNQEHFLMAILAVQPRIELPPEGQRRITETALGIAMENTGMFGAGPGFACGCHRSFRDDDFCEAEDPETWVPRAERIAGMLTAAGAIDYTPFFTACRAGDTETVEVMLQAGFPPNFSIYGHTTALCEAVQPGHEDVCDLLLCHGAAPNLPRPFYTSMVWGGEIYPVSLATEHPAILKRLLQAGADPNLRRDDAKETPVILALKFADRAQAEEVFDLVDFSSIRGKDGRSGIFYLEADQLEMCRHIIPSDLLDEHDGRGMTPLLHAITLEDIVKARLLIEMGADPTLPGMIWGKDANGIFRAVATGHILTQRLTPIQAALQIGNVELVEYLFDLGAPADRHSLMLTTSRFDSDEESIALGDRLLADLADRKIGIHLTVGRYDANLPSHLFHYCEILMATLLLNHPEAAAKNYPGWIERMDLVDWAGNQCLHPAAIEPFRSGHMLGKGGWMQLLDEAIDELKQATETFAESLNSHHPDEGNSADTYDLLGPLRNAEHALLAANVRITGKPLEPLNLAAEVCERASGDFKGGTARAYRDAETTGEVGFDDFIEALAESFQSGSTMDHGKLLHAVRLVTARLEKRSSSLRRKI